MPGPDNPAPAPGLRLRASLAGVERTFDLRPGRLVLGSAAGCDVPLSVRGVSRRHATLVCSQDGLTIEDLGSRNGTRLNGARVTRAALRAGDEIVLGPVTLRVERADQPPAPPPAAAGGAFAPPLHAATLAAGALIAQLVAGKATRDALFLSAFGAAALPAVMLASSFLAVLVAVAFARALAARSPARVAPLAVALNAVLLVAEWGLSQAFPRAAAALVYLHVAAAGAAVVSGFWSLVSERFDPQAARGALGRIGGGASLGGLVGGALAWSVARRVPVASMLLMMAALNALAAAALRHLARRPPAELPSLAGAEAPGASGSLAGLRILREVPYLRHLALIVALGAVAESLLDYNLKAAAAAELARGAELMSFFALFHTAVSLLGLGAQTLATRPALQSLGLAGTVAVLPGTVLLGAAGTLAAPRLLAGTLARGGQAVLQGSLFRSGYELLFTAIAKHQKRPTKAIVDVAFDKLGGALGAGLVLLAVALWPGGATRVLAALAGACALAALALSRRLHRGYVQALAENLRSGAVLLDASQALDSTTRLTLLESGLLPGGAGPAAELRPDPVLQAAQALASGQPARVRQALLEAERLGPRLAPHVLPLLARDEHAAEAARALRALAPRATGQLVDALLDPLQPAVVRRRVARVLEGGEARRALDGLLQGLHDDELAVRQQCAQSALRLTEGGQAAPVPATLAYQAALRELRGWPPGRRLDDPRLAHVFALLELALEREPLRLASRAVCGSGPLRGVALEYLENVLPEPVRAALWPALGLAVPAAPAHPRPRQELVDELTRESGERAPVVR